MRFLARIRLATLILLLFAMAASAPVLAEKFGPDGAPNPTASVVDQQTLLNQVPRIEGRIDIPDGKAAVLMQPAGRTWDYFHEVLLHRGGAIVILGMIVVLAAAYLIMGRLRITAGRSGRKIVRFKAFERFAHWLTAVSFVILGLTGLNITFGKIVLLPVIGPDAFSYVSELSKYTHNFTSFAFMAGLLLIIVIFFRDNLPAKVDLDWVRQGGGFIRNRHAPGGQVQSGREAGLLAFACGRHCGFAVGPLAAVSLLRDRYRRHADRAGSACRHRRSVHRPDSRPHLYRHARHGRRVRGHGHRRGRCQLGEGASRSLAGPATGGQGPAAAFGDAGGMSCFDPCPVAGGDFTGPRKDNRQCRPRAVAYVALLR